MTKLVKDSENKTDRDYIFQDNAKTRFGATFIIVTLVILILAVVVSAVYFGWF